MSRTTCVAIVIAACCAQAAYGQWSWPPSGLRALDSALAIIGMARGDISMPADLLSNDPHRRPIHDTSFTDPLRPFDDIERVHGMLVRRTSASLDSAISVLMGDMGLGDFRREPFGPVIPAREITKKLKTDPEEIAGFVGATFLMRYISAVLQATDAMQVARDTFLQQQLLVDLCDSLWMNSEASETASLWELHDEEVRLAERSRAFVAKANPRQMNAVYVNGWSLYQQLMDYVREFPTAQDLLRDSVQTRVFETPAGRIAIGGAGNDRYEGTFLLIVDIGGDDSYHLQATKSQAMQQAVRCIVDFDGNDVYVASSYELGSGIAGAGIVIDRAGNDLYQAGDQSLGCGIFGIGIVHDLDGNDTYLGGQNTQGCGIYGMGILLDDAGFDTYRAHAQAQGFGATRGVGILDDATGNDHYLAASPYLDVLRYEAHHVTFTQGAALGMRPIASGGLGYLFDHNGNDVYSTDIYGQGTAYWFGIGALIDDAGEDRYHAYQYAQGSGVHFAAAMLRDRGGDDVYVSHGVSQGCGHDVATGILLDEAGNDSYTAESLSLGGGNANAVSILLDVAGNDAYVAHNASNTMGFSDYRRGYGMLGLFVDAQGDDRYGSAARNNSSTVQSTYGAFADLEFPIPTEPAVAPPAPSATNEALRSTVDSLMVQASAAPLRFQGNVKPARQRLTALGPAALSGLARYLGTQMPRERLALEEVLPAIHATSPADVRRLLRDSLESTNATTVGTTLTICGKVKDSALLSAIQPLTQHERWQYRRNAIQALQEIGHASVLPMVTPGLADSHPYVRARAAFAVGRLGGINAMDTLKQALIDDSQIVRFSAVEGLARGERRPVANILGWLRSLQDRRFVRSGLRLLGAADTTRNDIKALDAWYRSASVWQREALVHIAPSLPPFWQQRVRAMASEPNRKAGKRRTRTAESKL